MLTNEQYIKLSLEYNLFFLRIAKEHATFAAASLPPKDMNVAQQFLGFKNNFDKLLGIAISLSNGKIGPEVLSSGELVTDLTLTAEKATSFLTGIPINTELTSKELALVSKPMPANEVNLINEVSMLNKQAISLLNKIVAFQTNILNQVLSCKAFSYTYPLMLDHVTREAKMAAMILTRIQSKGEVNSVKDIITTEINWNRIMHEHAEFIRGYLDPSEDALFEKSNAFAKTLENLLNQTLELQNQPNRLPEITRKSIAEVTQLRNFKRTGEEGILACKIKSIIPPLLSDHVLREANHYLRLLKQFEKI